MAPLRPPAIADPRTTGARLPPAGTPASRIRSSLPSRDSIQAGSSSLLLFPFSCNERILWFSLGKDSRIKIWCVLILYT
jgi:hypothetical protein